MYVDRTILRVAADERLPNEPGIVLHETTPGNPVPFTPLPSSAACVAGGQAEQILLPTGYVASVIAREGAGYPDLADMNTVNETGARPGRFLYRTHEIGSNGPCPSPI